MKIPKLLAYLTLVSILSGAEGRGEDLQKEITLRARVMKITPEQKVRISWRWGGEGLGGKPIHGELTARPPMVPSPPDDSAKPKVVDSPLEAASNDRNAIVEHGGTPDSAWLKPGAWSSRVPLSDFKASTRRLFMTFTVEGMKGRGNSRLELHDTVVEFEFHHHGRLLQQFSEIGPDGPTFGIVVPLDKLGTGPKPASAFVAGLESVSAYAKDRAARLQSLPWAGAPVPKRYAFLTDCAGYRPGVGYAIRTTNKEAMLAEFRALRQLGINGFRNAPDFALAMIRAGDDLGCQFARIRDQGGLGYPVPRHSIRDPASPAAGCPFHPAMTGFHQKVQADAARLMNETVRKLPVEEYWLLTVDEIGSVFDLATEGKEHPGCCPYCRRAFREYLKGFGLTPADFDAATWDDLRSVNGYWAKTRAEREAEKPMAERFDTEKTVVDKSDEEAARQAKSRPVTASPNVPAGQSVAVSGKRPPMSKKGWALLSYYSKRFNNDSSAMLLAPQREWFDGENTKKRSALAAGRLDAPEARQPWVYCYSLRGNTFLMGGHSLDFFDFYRKADSGFMYETSNRDPRVWQWDSYLCDVGRTLSEKFGKRFGIYVKPHRGAAIQRAVTALARNAKVVYWYTYGPDWVKGDSFSEFPWALAAVSRAARLVGTAEDTLYEARWQHPAEIALLRPRTSEVFENSASWENGKWVYAALAHAHLPIDAIDEEMVLSEDLSQYKAIYVSGSHLRRTVAERLARWVETGGTLYTSGWGLARDECDQPLACMYAVLGLKSRSDVELWSEVNRYAAVALSPLRPLKVVPQEAATVNGAQPPAGGFRLAVGREPLNPLPETQVLARFGDGKPAATRHAYGKGTAYIVGFYSGLEYSTDILRDDYDLSRDFQPSKRALVAAPALAAGARPVVDASVPLVEGVLLRNAKSGQAAVTLVNWAYRAKGGGQSPFEPPGKSGLVSFEPITVAIRGAGRVREVRSAWSGKTLLFQSREKDIVVTLPHIEEADVLLLQYGD